MFIFRYIYRKIQFMFTPLILINKFANGVILRVFTAFFVLSLLTSSGLLFPRHSEAYQYKNNETGADFVLVGVGVFRQNLTSVDGDEIIFEDGDDGFPTDYSNQSYLSLYGEGYLNKDWQFSLTSQYDEEDPDQAFTFLLELKKDKHYAIIGDHKEGSFLNTFFTVSNDTMRGLTLHGETEAVRATVMAGAVRGESTTDEIRGDGTSGRYQLSEAPVIRGNETIRIEIRDRNNPTRVIKSTSQIRGRDYTIDYDRGEIMFTSPVEESDFTGNPVFIVANYQYDSPGGLYNRARYGLQTTADVLPGLEVGVTYLADSDWEDKFSSAIIDKRQQIVGGTVSYNHNDRHKLSVELARSDIPSLESQSDDTAFRAEFLTSPLTDLTLQADYWRVGKDFLTFGNYDLASGSITRAVDNETPFYFISNSIDFDLDPNNTAALGTNMESYGVSGSYNFGSHTASTGFRHFRDNIPDETEQPTEFRDNYFVTLSSFSPEGNGYMVGAELLKTHGDDTAINDSDTRRLIGGIRHLVGQSSLTGPITLQGVYQYEQFDDQDVDDNSTTSHDLLTRIELLPLHNFTLFAEGGVNYLYRESVGDYSERSLLGLLGCKGEINRYFQLDGNVKYRIYNDFNAERDTTKTLLGAEFWWDVRSNLLFHGSYEREWDEIDTVSGNNEISSYDDILFRLDWQLSESASLFAYYRLEYDKLETEPLDETRVRTTTEMIGAKYQFSEKLEAVTAYRRKVLDDDADNYKLKAYGEVSYAINRYLSIAPGYEYSRYDKDESEEYEAHVFYINLIGKL